MAIVQRPAFAVGGDQGQARACMVDPTVIPQDDADRPAFDRRVDGGGGLDDDGVRDSLGAP